MSEGRGTEAGRSRLTSATALESGASAWVAGTVGNDGDVCVAREKNKSDLVNPKKGTPVNARAVLVDTLARFLLARAKARVGLPANDNDAVPSG